MTSSILADLPADQRPRERMLRLGPDALTDIELVALLLGSGRRGASALTVARELLDRHGGLDGLSRVDSDTVAATLGVGPAKATRLVAALALARRFGTSTDRRGVVRSPTDIARVVAPLLLDDGSGPQVAVVLCDRANRLLGTVVLPGDAHAHPFPVRAVLAEALRREAVALAVAHRHPGEDPTPEPVDHESTDRLADAAGRCGLRLVDHLVVAGTRWRAVLADCAGEMTGSAR